MVLGLIQIHTQFQNFLETLKKNPRNQFFKTYQKFNEK